MTKTPPVDVRDAGQGQAPMPLGLISRICLWNSAGVGECGGAQFRNHPSLPNQHCECGDDFELFPNRLAFFHRNVPQLFFQLPRCASSAPLIQDGARKGSLAVWLHVHGR